MKKYVSFSAALLFTFVTAGVSYAELGGQVFYRYGKSKLDDARGNQIYADANNATGAGVNDDDSGRSVAAGLDIPLTKHGNNTLLGEVMLEYSRFSRKKVQQTTSVLDTVVAGEGGAKPVTTSNVTVSELMVLVAPKYRFDLGKVRAWIIPAGLAFLVNSPPSDDSTYLDIGFHYGAGVEYMVTDLLSVGVDYRETRANGDPNIKASYSNMSLYVGINF